MAKQKLIILVGSICILILIAGIVSMNYFTEIPNTSADTSTYTDDSSSSTGDNPVNTNETEPSGNNTQNLQDETWESSDVTNIIFNIDSITARAPVENQYTLYHFVQ
jgi:hypothetical protein